MLFHVGQQPRVIFEEPRVPQLVQLVRPNGGELQKRLDINEIRRAGRHRRDTGAGERDLAGGAELVDQIGVSGLFAFRDNVRYLGALPIEAVDAIGVVPEDAEISCRGPQIGKASDHIIAEHDPCGVLVFRHTPDALHRLVLHQTLHQCHIRAVFIHRHRDQLEAEMLCDGKVPVIARHGTQELTSRHRLPRRAAADALGHTVADDLIHQRQAAVAAHDGMGGVGPHHMGQQPLGLWDAVKAAVVAAVLPALAVQNAAVIQLVQQLQRQRQLLRGGLAPRQIQRHAPLFVFPEPVQALLLLLCQRRAIH